MPSENEILASMFARFADEQEIFACFGETIQAYERLISYQTNADIAQLPYSLLNTHALLEVAGRYLGKIETLTRNWQDQYLPVYRKSVVSKKAEVQREIRQVLSNKTSVELSAMDVFSHSLLAVFFDENFNPKSAFRKLGLTSYAILVAAKEMKNEIWKNTDASFRNVSENVIGETARNPEFILPRQWSLHSGKPYDVTVIPPEWSSKNLDWTDSELQELIKNLDFNANSISRAVVQEEYYCSLQEQEQR